MAGSAVFTTVVLALVAKDGALSCSLRPHNNRGPTQSSTTDSTLVSTPASNGSSLTQHQDTSVTIASNPVTDSSHQTPVTPLFVAEPPLVASSLVDQNQILAQLQSLQTSTYGPIPLLSPFSSPFSIYGGSTSYLPGFENQALQQQVDPNTISPSVETIDTELFYRMLPSLLSSPAFKDYFTETKAVLETGPVITPNEITKFNSNAPPTGPIVEPISVPALEANNAPVPNSVSNIPLSSTPTPQSSSSPCPQCNSTSSAR